MRWLLFATCLLTVRCDEEYEFWEAAEAGDTTAMARLLESAPDIDLDYPDADGRTPLLLATLGNHAGAVRFLLQRGADAEVPGRWPAPPHGPLATAAALNHVATMDVLLEGGAAANAATGPDGRTPLLVAAEAGSLDAVDLFLSVGADVDERRLDGATAACAAAQGGHADVLRRLLDAGANVHVSDSVDGSSLVHYAARAPTAAAVKLVLAAGADPRIRSGVGVPTDATFEDGREPAREDLRGGLTPLMASAASAASEALEALLDFATRHVAKDELANYVDAVDASGRTALAWAAASPARGPAATACLELLYAHGARDDSVTVEGDGLLHIAARGNARAVAYLVDARGFEVDQRALSEQRSTPLMLAASEGAVTAAKALLRRGADVDATASDGSTPLHAAASAGQTPVARLLLKRGANPLAQLAGGEFPSQKCPKTPRGRMLKYSLSRAERIAWSRLEKAFGGAEPPDAAVEDGIDAAAVEDLEADEEDSDRDEL